MAAVSAARMSGLVRFALAVASAPWAASTRRRAAVDEPQSCHDRGIVSEGPVSVELDEVDGDPGHIVGDLRSLHVAREAHGLPGGWIPGDGVLERVSAFLERGDLAG